MATPVPLSAMTYWTFTIEVNGSSLPSADLILIMVGACGTVMSAFVFSMSRSSELTHHTFDSRVSVLHGGFRSCHQETMRPTQRVLSSATTRPPLQ